MKNNLLYTTVTTTDFEDRTYIEQLLQLSIGIELALLTPIPLTLNHTQYQEVLTTLKKELTLFQTFFSQFNILPASVRIHQPGGCMYYWNEHEGIGYRLLKEFFTWCSAAGFSHYIIHAPYGSSSHRLEEELNQYREKLHSLAPATVEVEEIVASHTSSDKSSHLRLYSGNLFEKLMLNQQATILIDVYEAGGIKAALALLKNRLAKGFVIRSLHLQKNKHHMLSSAEFAEIAHCFEGTLVNEGFIKDTCSFDEFIKTRSTHCVIAHPQRIEQLRQYQQATHRS